MFWKISVKGRGVIVCAKSCIQPILILGTVFGVLNSPAFAFLPMQNLQAPPTTQASSVPRISHRYVPGQMIVKYKSSVTLSVREAVKNRVRFKDITLDRSDSLDKLHKKFSVRKAKPIFRSEAEEDAILGPKTLTALKEIHHRQLAQAKNNLSIAAAMTPPAFQNDADISHVYVLELSPNVKIETAVKDFANDPHVEYAQPNYIVRAQFTPNDPFWATSKTWGQLSRDLWGLSYDNTERAWDISQGAGVTVAVVDSGVDYNHPDIAANLVSGWNFINNTDDTMDDFGHGTHIAGIIAATGNNNIGVIGVAPLARIMPIKFLDQFGSGKFDAAAAAIVYAAEHGANVINNSWECDEQCPNNPVIEDAVRTAYSLGAVIVFSAGNASDDVFYYSPQNMPQVILAAATTPHDKPNFFSNHGGDLDISAPGGGALMPLFFNPYDPNAVNILSLKAAGCNPAIFCPAELIVGGDYVRQAGTSMAAGYVSGLAALILAKNPEYTAEQVRQAIRITGKDIGSIGYDTATGYGRIRPVLALKTATPLAALITQPSSITATGITEIATRGITGGPGFKDWTLAYRKSQSNSDWKILVKDSKTASAIDQDALLTNWKIRSLQDGPYTLKLTVRSTNGHVYEDRQAILIDQTAIQLTGAQIFNGGNLFRSDVTLFGTAAPTNFLNYQLQVRNSSGVLLVNPNITLTQGGAQKIYNGELGTWHTSGAPADNYTIELIVNLKNGSSVVKSTEAFIYDPTVHPGWPVNLSFPSAQNSSIDLLDHLTVADIDRDGKSELIIGYGNSVRIFDHTGAALHGWPQSIDPADAGYLIQRSPVVADLDGDGSPEIIAANNNGEVFIWRADGMLLPGWPKQLADTTPTLVASALDTGAMVRIILTTPYGLVNVLDIDGNSLPGWPQQLDSGIFGVPAVGDMNHDGTKEILVSNESKLYALDYLGNLLPNWPKQVPFLNSKWSAYPALGDVTGNGALNAVVTLTDSVSLNSAVYVFQYDGQTVAIMPTATPYPNPPGLADINGDGKTDIVVGNQLVFDGGIVPTDYLNAWNGDGTILNSAWPVKILDVTNDSFVYNTGFGFGSPTLVDVEGKGQIDIVASSDTRLFAVNAYRPDGSPVPGFPKPSVTIGAHQSNAIAVADLDGDGLLELAWIDANLNLWVWDLPVSNSPIPTWRMFRHDPGHSAATN
ncbi:MAG: S8 family serine peptidase [Gammaproteobacteria bacterium]|nr:S8 family serine peptidase [Gammaproteobacteria bacterium]